MSDFQFTHYPEIKTLRAILERMLARPRDYLVFSQGRYRFAGAVGATYVDTQQANLGIALDLLSEVQHEDYEGPGVAYRSTLVSKRAA